MASTSTFVRVAERPAVAAAPVDVKKKEVGNLRHGDTAAPQYRACDRLRDDDGRLWSGRRRRLRGRRLARGGAHVRLLIFTSPPSHTF